MNKKALTPITATALLMLFAIALGTVVMNWSKNYITNVSEEKTVSTEKICDPLSALKLRYVNHEITDVQYKDLKKTLDQG